MSKKDQQEASYSDEEYGGETLGGEQPDSGAGNGEAPVEEQPDPEAGDGEAPVEEQPDSEAGDGETSSPEFCTIEEHAKRLKTPTSVFAAVMQTRKWAAGKKVTETEFKTAVEEFLGAPIGGKKAPPPENKEQK